MQCDILPTKSVSVVIFTRIMACDTPKQAWDKLNEEFQVEKVITTLLKRYESKISSLEDSMDLSTISLSELINNKEGHVEGAFQARNREAMSSSSHKEKKSWSDKKDNSKKESGKKKYPLCSYCKKLGHLEKFCWFRPNA
ncbi:pleiotropic drug resistance protein 3-like [Gossypium australe]|uniref:Pleiotropic drug resistance protein 3-like n=1 Tax=Gossypium australe TaxID=47621 RepID=A0A5B6WDP4_9ROSI|nr:pleiotropic drug resistance protein 3-like [Gossypium australe]